MPGSTMSVKRLPWHVRQRLRERVERDGERAVAAAIGVNVRTLVRMLAGVTVRPTSLRVVELTFERELEHEGA